MGLVNTFFKKFSKKNSVDLYSLDNRKFISEKHQCPQCHEHIEEEILRAQLYVCAHCQYHFRINAKERLSFLFDGGQYENISSKFDTPLHNPLGFPGYTEKLKFEQQKSMVDEAVMCGIGTVLGHKISVASMSFQFMGGSMGSTVGERILQVIFHSIKEKIPCLITTASGGARMHEGLFSLMQMARTSHAVALLHQMHIPLFVLLTDPTTGGVTASFGMLGDVILAEQQALGWLCRSSRDRRYHQTKTSCRISVCGISKRKRVC